MTTEPVSITAAITAALTSTIAILLFLGVDPDLVGAITLAVTGWVGVVAAVVRSRVTPNQNVALTTTDVEALKREFPTTTNLGG